ncbi:MAG: VOC family protein [Thermoplasmatales archaeon]|nr:VOC family protein [Thermoplasmatales archaeon]
MIDHVNAFVLAVSDVKKSAEFYRDKLGFVLKEISDDFAYLRFAEAPGPGFALVSKMGLEKKVLSSSTADSDRHGIYFASFLKNADKEFESLQSKGVSFVSVRPIDLTAKGLHSLRIQRVIPERYPTSPSK